MSIIYGLTDPITKKPYNFTLLNMWEEHLYTVLDTILDNHCPPDAKDYLCNKTEGESATELEPCAECYRQWAYKHANVKTPKAKRLLQAIDMAVQEHCPPEGADRLCQVTEDESTDEGTCKLCIQRWATIPFAEFRK